MSRQPKSTSTAASAQRWWTALKLQKIGDEHFAGLFAEDELTGYLRNMLRATGNGRSTSVIYDSDTERQFAELRTNDGVVLYAKLPSWFKVPTCAGPVQRRLGHPV